MEIQSISFFWFGMREVFRAVLLVPFPSPPWDNINAAVKGHGPPISTLSEIEDKLCCKLKIMKMLHVEML